MRNETDVRLPPLIHSFCRCGCYHLLYSFGALHEGSATEDPRGGPRDLAQHPIYTLLDAIPRAACMVDRQAAHAAFRYERPPQYNAQLNLILGLDSDLYEIALLLAACFLVNYVTADSKTNWAEGYIMITFYMLIVRAPLSHFRIELIYLRSCPLLLGPL